MESLLKVERMITKATPLCYLIILSRQMLWRATTRLARLQAIILLLILSQILQLLLVAIRVPLGLARLIWRKRLLWPTINSLLFNSSLQLISWVQFSSSSFTNSNRWQRLKVITRVSLRINIFITSIREMMRFTKYPVISSKLRFYKRNRRSIFSIAISSLRILLLRLLNSFYNKHRTVMCNLTIIRCMEAPNHRVNYNFKLHSLMVSF